MPKLLYITYWIRLNKVIQTLNLRYMNNNLLLAPYDRIIIYQGHYLSFEEEITSKNKNPPIISHQIEAILFPSTCGLENSGMSLGYSPFLAGKYSVTCRV